MSHNIVVPGGTTVLLPTAGKYCDRDIVVTAEGGGLSLDVVTASSLPGTVVDGQIVVITDTTPGTVYIDTDEPANPVAGDLWIRMEAGADVALVLTEESPYVGGGLVEAKQWNGSAWPPLYGYLGVNGAWVQFSTSLPPVGTALNDMTWEQISAVAKSGLASTYFSAGDAKEIVINGAVGSTTFSGLSIWAFIIGINHNPSLEGENKIHFQIGKSEQTSGQNLCLVSGSYNYTSSNANLFVMNTSGTNKGAWADCNMRKKILGSDSDPTAPLANSLLAALPEDLRNVMCSVQKYTDNNGGGANAGTEITATTDYLWLLSEWETFGKRTGASTNEQNYQEQYEFYASGNSAVFNKHNAKETAAKWWLRSPYVQYADGFCFVQTSGAPSGDSANYVYGIAPCFCV